MAIWIPSSPLASSISHSIARRSGQLFPNGRVLSSSHVRRGYQRSLSSLVYFDKGVAVANKPSGLLCQLNRRKSGEGHVINGELEDFLNGTLRLQCQKWRVNDISSLADMKRELKLESLPYPMHRLDKVSRQIHNLSSCSVNISTTAHHGRIDIRIESTNGTRYFSAIPKPQDHQEVSCCRPRWKQDVSGAVGNNTDELVHRFRGTGELVAARGHRREDGHV